MQNIFQTNTMPISKSCAIVSIQTLNYTCLTVKLILDASSPTYFSLSWIMYPLNKGEELA